MTTTSRVAATGICSNCGRRILVGELPSGDLVATDCRSLTPANELLARARGRRTVRARWKSGPVLNLRTDHEVRVRPAGYAGSRIYPEHHCTPTGETR